MELPLSEIIINSQSDSQSVEKSIHFYIFKNYSNLMQMFRADLKIFLDLPMPNQCCHADTK